MKQGVSGARPHPFELKKKLAAKIVRDFHGDAEADKALKDFESEIQEKGLPSDLPANSIDSPIKLFRLLTSLKLTASNAEAQRKIKEGAVYMAAGDSTQPEWQRMTDPNWEFDPHEKAPVIFRLGSSNIPEKLRKVTFKSS